MDARYQQLAPNRFVIRDLDLIKRTIPKWLGQDFAWDFETSGLDPRKDRPLGLAITLADGRSFYLCLAHTEVHGEIVQRTMMVEHLDGYDEVPVLTKTGKQACTKDGTPKTKRVKRMVTVEEPYDDDQRTFVLREYMAEADFAAAIAPLFNQPNVTMVAHNVKFDLAFMTRIGVAVRGCLVDTMLAAKLIDENREVGLKDLASRELGMDMTAFTNLPRYPGFAKEEFLGVPLEDGSDYAMRDTEATWGLWQKYREQMAVEQVESAFFDLWMPLCVTLGEMEQAGIGLDLNLVRQVRAEYEAKARTAERAVWRQGIDMVLSRYRDDAEGLLASPFVIPLARVAPEADPDAAIVEIDGVELPVLRTDNRNFQPRVPHFNVGSGPHLQTLLYDHLRLRAPAGVRLKRNDNGLHSVDADTLKTLAFHLGDDTPQALKDILTFRKAEKMIGTYLDRFLAEADPDNFDSIYTNLNQHITDTGRLSSSSPNLQNIPSRGEEGHRCRQMFVARPGRKLVVADYSQMELRVLAHYSQDAQLLRAFAEGLDLHVLTGAGQAGLTYEELLRRVEDGDPEAKKLRSIGKTSNFGLSYGMGAKKYQGVLLVQNSLRVDVGEAQRLINQYNETYAGSTEWKHRVMRWVRQHGYVGTIGGRKRRLPGIWSDDKLDVLRAERQAVNAIIQGSCADIMAIVIPPLQHALFELGGRLLLQVHDELVAEVREDRAEEAAALMGRLMTEPINGRLRVPLTAEAGIGDNWYAAK